MPEAALHVASGKVREIYELDEERLLLVASDRISTWSSNAAGRADSIASTSPSRPSIALRRAASAPLPATRSPGGAAARAGA